MVEYVDTGEETLFHSSGEVIGQQSNEHLQRFSFAQRQVGVEVLVQQFLSQTSSQILLHNAEQGKENN